MPLPDGDLWDIDFWGDCTLEARLGSSLSTDLRKPSPASSFRLAGPGHGVLDVEYSLLCNTLQAVECVEPEIQGTGDDVTMEECNTWEPKEILDWWDDRDDMAKEESSRTESSALMELRRSVVDKERWAPGRGPWTGSPYNIKPSDKTLSPRSLGPSIPSSDDEA